MKSISFIVNENLEKPLLTLLQPKASPRTNATEFLEITYNGWRMVNAPEVRSVEWNTTLRKLWNQRKRDRFSVQFSKKEFDGWKEAERYKSFRKRIPADVIRFQEGRSTAEPVADDEKKKLKIDFRVQGIPQAAVEQEEKANTNNWKGQCFQSEITQAENWDVQAFHWKLATNEFIFHTRSFAYRTLWLHRTVHVSHAQTFSRAWFQRVCCIFLCVFLKTIIFTSGCHVSLFLDPAFSRLHSALRFLLLLCLIFPTWRMFVPFRKLVWPFCRTGSAHIFCMDVSHPSDIDSADNDW